MILLGSLISIPTTKPLTDVAWLRKIFILRAVISWDNMVVIGGKNNIPLTVTAALQI